jgi:protoporphyrinogen oxidase
MAGFGPGLCEIFMTPYNCKVWAYPPEQMNVEWMGERVATVDTKRVLNNVLTGKDELGWGPNNIFRFPTKGGTGIIYDRMFKALPQEHVRLNSTVVGVDAAAKTVTLKDGTVIEYDHLISTMPLDKLCLMTTNLPAETGLTPDVMADKASQFKHSSSHIVGFGMDGQPPEHLKSKCWMYFPEDDCPFYRATGGWCELSDATPFHVAPSQCAHKSHAPYATANSLLKLLREPLSQAGRAMVAHVRGVGIVVEAGGY